MNLCLKNKISFKKKMEDKNKIKSFKKNPIKKLKDNDCINYKS